MRSNLHLLRWRGWWFVTATVLLWAGCVGWLTYLQGWLSALLVTGGALFGTLAVMAVLHWSLIKWLVYVSRRLDRMPPGAKLWFNEADRDYLKWSKPDDPNKWH